MESKRKKKGRRKKLKMNTQNKNRLIETEAKGMVARGKRMGEWVKRGREI